MVTVCDGTGREWTAELTQATLRRAQARLLAEHPPETPSRLAVTLAQVAPRGAAMDLIVAKATELGVSRIVPLEADRHHQLICQVRIASDIRAGELQQRIDRFVGHRLGALPTRSQGRESPATPRGVRRQEQGAPGIRCHDARRPR